MLVGLVMNVQLKFVASTWAQRAQAELGAEKRFRQLVEQMKDLKVHKTVIAFAIRAQQDEIEHAHMCAKVAKEYGHATGFEHFSSQIADLEASWSQRAAPEERLLCETVLMCCITETINASLLNSIYRSSKTSSTQKIVHKILKDEVKHSQIGWAHLAYESESRDCGFLADYLAEMLSISVKDELFLPVANVDDSDSFDYGVMPVSLRLNQFKETILQVVLPGFEKFGIETSKARNWLIEKAA